jgi:hypothetical protein
MNRLNWVRASALVGSLLIALPGCKKDEPKPGTPGSSAQADTSSPKKAAQSLARAFTAGDVQGAKAVSTGTDEQMKGLERMVPMGAELKKMVDAAIAKWGKDNQLVKQFGDVVNREKMIDDADIKESGDTATVTYKEQGEKQTKLVKKDGQWKVDLSSMGSMPSEKEAKQATDAAREVADEITKGKYPDANAAMQAFGMKAAGISAPPTSVPAVPGAPSVPSVPGTPPG